LAGTGADMLTLHRLSGGRIDITGVDVNPLIFEAGLRLPQLRLQEFFSLPNIHFHIDEARTFLERDQNRYDVILVAFSGSPAAFYTGTISSTTHSMYTVESMQSLLAHLSDKGTLVIMN